MQGSRGGRIAQEDIAPVFRKILTQRPEAAGAIAEIMNNWSRFELADGMAQTMTDARVDEGSRLLIANYLLSSSRATTRRE